MRKILPPIILLLVHLFPLTCQCQNIRYQNNIRGGFAIASNAFTYRSEKIFANTDNGTTMSSYSDLILPAGSSIVKAYLYVEGFTSNKITSIRFKVPGGSYALLTTATSGFIANPQFCTTAGTTQLCESQFIYDVTSLIPPTGYISTVTPGGDPSGAGRYSAADLLPTGTGYIYGYGWSMFVVYTNPASKNRSVTIADACNTGNATVTINNVAVQPSGVINAVVGLTGTYGDLGLQDFAAFGKAGTSLTALTDPTTLTNNDIFNGTIGFAPQNNVSADGGPAMSGNYPARNPYNDFTKVPTASPLDNTWYSLFYDCDIMDASGMLPNSTTPISVSLSKSTAGGDAIGFGTYAISVDIAAANVSKSISPNIISDGGIATYTFLLENTVVGTLNLPNLGFTDNLPGNLMIANPSGASITGGTGGVITATPGTGSISVSGLNLNINETATLKVNVTNKPGMLNSDCISNPTAFTNGFSNIVNNTPNLANSATPQCLLVNVLAVPIELLNFKADLNKNNVALTWSTASERNSDKFDIERSSDGINFETIASTKAAGNSSEIKNYAFTDHSNTQQLPDNTLYYRLKQFDFNGRISYSKIISIEPLRDLDAIVVNPQPMLDLLSVTLNSKTNDKAVFSIFDLTGKCVEQYTKALNTGQNTIGMDVLQLYNGVYILQITSAQGLNKRIKIIK